MNELLFGSGSVPKKRGVKKIITLKDETITGGACMECSLKGNIITTLNTKLECLENKLKEKKKIDEEEKRQLKEQKLREKPVLSEEEIEAKRLLKEEKARKKEEEKMRLEKLEEDNTKIKAELLTRFGVTM
jgi:hypothetical protein